MSSSERKKEVEWAIENIRSAIQHLYEAQEDDEKFYVWEIVETLETIAKVLKGSIK